MALTPTDSRHAQQIQAGIAGRNRGHQFEHTLADTINNLTNKTVHPLTNDGHIFTGNPATILLQYIVNEIKTPITDVRAFWLGGLATSGLGDALLTDNGTPITGSKSDILLQLTTNNGIKTVGVSIKTCNKTTPTNDQMYFTTARAFCQLLKSNGIEVNSIAEKGLSMFCGDAGNRPIDLLTPTELSCRISDPNRYFWEELPLEAQKSWNSIFQEHQDEITLLLFQKAYKDDPYPPDFLLHQTVRYENFTNCNIALFTMQEIVKLSRKHCGFVFSEYKIKKGTYKNDPNTHLAPRFGFIQFQRGGQKQHPTQLQFNLKAGYFKHI